MSESSPPTATILSPQIRRWLYRLIVTAAAAQGLAAILTATVLYSPARWPENKPPHSPMYSANDRSRWVTVWSLAERGTFTIDEIIQVPGWDTIDKVRHNGHFYSSKPALLPTVVAGLYWVLKQTAGLDLLTQTHETVQAILLVVQWLPWVISLVLIARMAERYAQNDWSRLFVVVAAAFGTFLTTFLVTFNNHNIAAACVVFAISPALRIVNDGRREWWRFALAGFWGALAACNELPAALFGLGLFVMVVRSDARRTLAAFVPAAAVPLAAFFITTYVSTGSWLPFYAKFGTEAYKYVHEGIPSYWMQPSGIDRGEHCPGMYLLHCTFGHHGIFSLTPVFLLTLATWCVATKHFAARIFGRESAAEHALREPRNDDLEARRVGEGRPTTDAHPLQPIIWQSLLLTIWVLGFYLAQKSSYNYGGNTSGLRWTFWLIPLWLLAMIPAMDRWADRRGVRVICVALLGMSVFSVTMPHNNPWQPPWLQNVMENLGWVNYDEPSPEPFSVPRRSWFGPLPMPTEEDSHPWVAFAGDVSQGSARHWRLEQVSLVPALGPKGQVLRFTERSKDSVRQTELRFQISEQNLANAIGLIVPDSGEGLWDVRKFLSGLPVATEYKPGSIRYLKLPLRPHEAFKCRLASAQVRYQQDRNGPELNYRRTVWLTDELPFGVAQIEDTVTDLRDNSVVFKQRLTAVAASSIGGIPTKPTTTDIKPKSGE